MHDEPQRGSSKGIDWLADSIGRRNLRRWQRRARIAGPFLAVPAMLGLLVLSVGLIEYQPQKSHRTASERPAPAALRRAPADGEAILVEPQDLSSLSVVESPLPSLATSPSLSSAGAGGGAMIDPLHAGDASGAR